jgi:hypothetical protein
MANTHLSLWIEPAENKLYKGWQINALAEGLNFRQGDSVEIDLHLIKRINSQYGIMDEIEFPAGATIRFAIGRLDTPATSGSYAFTYDGDTAVIAYNATQAQISTAINGLASITSAGGVTVVKINSTTVKVTFDDTGVNTPVTLDASELFPSSSARVITLKNGSVSTRGSFLLKLTQAPCVYQDEWVNTPTPTISVVDLISGIAKRVSISPPPKTGTWLATTTASIRPKVLDANGSTTNVPTFWTESYTEPFSVTAVAADFLYGTGSTVDSNKQGLPKFQADVKATNDYTWDFFVRDDYAKPSGYTLPLTVNGGGITGYKSKTATVSFNTAELEVLMNGETEATAYLEIEMEESSGARRTLLQTTCTIANDLIDQTTYSPLSFSSEVPEAPQDGEQYVRKDGGWQILSIDGGTY